MAFKQADRVKETTTTTGTGILSLAGAAAQFQTFIAGIGTTNTCDYCLLDANGTAWEVGTGTVTSGSPNTLSRTTVYASTNSGSQINLSAGTHSVFCTGAANHLTHSLDLDNALGATQGNIAYRSATGWTVLPPGTTGQFLQTSGAGANPVWAAASGGSGGSSSTTDLVFGSTTQSIFSDNIFVTNTAVPVAVGDCYSFELIVSGYSGGGAGVGFYLTNNAKTGGYNWYYQNDANLVANAYDGSYHSLVASGSGAFSGTYPDIVRIYGSFAVGASSNYFSFDGAGNVRSYNDNRTLFGGTSVYFGAKAPAFANILKCSITKLPREESGSGNTYLSSGLYASLIPGTPTQANTGFSTWVNQGGATLHEGVSGLSIRAPAGSDNLRVLKRASLIAPFSKRFLVGLSILANAYQQVSVGFTDGTKFQHLSLAFDGGGPSWVIAINQWTSVSASSSNTVWSANTNPCWFRLRNDGTTVYFEHSISGDANDFVVLHTETVGSGYLSAYTDMVFLVNRANAGGSSDAVGTLFSAPDDIATASIPVNLENLGNVTITSPAAGQSLSYTGTAWTNSPPTQASTGFTTWGNQGSATVTDTSVGMVIAAPSNGNVENMRILSKAAPTAPYKITAQIGLLSSFVYTEHVVACIGWYDGTKTSQIGGHIGGVNGQGSLVNIQCANNTTLSVQSSANDVIQMGNPFWVQLYNDGTAVHFLVSIDGKNFRSLRDTVILGSFLANYNSIFFSVDPYGSSITATLMAYRQE